MSFLDQIDNEPTTLQVVADEPYKLSNDNNVADLLSDMDTDPEHFEPNTDTERQLSEFESQQRPTVEDTKEAELTSSFLVGCLDMVLNQSCKLIAKDRETDFSMSNSEKSDLEAQARAMLKGKSVMPPWMRFTVTLLMIIFAKGMEAFELRKEREKRMEVEAENVRLREELDDIKKNKQSNANV